MTLLQLDRVSVQLGNTLALRDCSLQLAAGERLALVGANGSGKTTLLKTLHGLLTPSSGQLQVPAVSLRQAMVFQQPHMLRSTVRHNVALGVYLQGRAWRPALDQADKVLAALDLAVLAGRQAKALSSGQQQRVALARAWAVQPQLLLLDEPTASLDPAAKRDVEGLMAEFAATGMTLVFSSHHWAQVKRLATRVLYLEQGRIAVDLPTHDFFQGPLPEAAQNFLQGERA